MWGEKSSQQYSDKRTGVRDLMIHTPAPGHFRGDVAHTNAFPTSKPRSLKGPLQMLSSNTFKSSLEKQLVHKEWFSPQSLAIYSGINRNLRMSRNGGQKLILLFKEIVNTMVYTLSKGQNQETKIHKPMFKLDLKVLVYNLSCLGG